MNRKKQFLQTIDSKRAVLKELGIKQLGLFGSVQRGDDTKDSDLDVLVDFQPGSKCFDSLYELHEILSNSLKCDIDIVTRKSLSPVIGAKILKEIDYVQITA
jgi:predicted nucleotidyltransferase